MKYEIINLFGSSKSRGTFDDLYDVKKYSSMQAAYDANDYVQGNYVKDAEGTLYIELFNVKDPDTRKVHKLNFQRCFAGIDALDDNLACEMGVTLF